jgi:Icc-related predicted phosphoesterase
MKILAVGDFHGKFALKKFEKIIKKENIDLVVSTGDYLPFFYRKLWFKHCYGKEVELWEVIGKRKYRKLVFEDIKRGEKVLKKLNKLPVPVATVLGNVDYPSIDDISDRDVVSGKKQQGLSWERKTLFAERLKKYKNIHRFDYDFFRYNEYVFIGARGHTAPGEPRSKGYKRHKKKLEKLFRKFRKENRQGKVIFVAHNLPYNIKMDKISKKADKEVRGKHYGSKMFRSIVNKYKPVLCIGGHFHENQGRDKMKKTVIVNPGETGKGKAIIIDLNEKIKMRFLR